MYLPIQSMPVGRTAAGAAAGEIAPAYWCNICYSAVEGVLDEFIGESCAVVELGFEAACNAALDFIPIIGEGPGEAVCAGAGIALGVVCEAGAGTLTKDMVSTIAHKGCDPIC